jgi:signal peptidase
LARTKLSKTLKNSYVTTIILAAILLGGVFGFWFGLKATLRTEYPLLAVASGSMIPTLNVGDLIVVQGVLNASEINAAPEPDGTIIVFHKSNDLGELIVHRAIGKVSKNGEWYFTTQGDANSGSASWEIDFPESLIVGKVVGIVPWIGNVPLFVRTTQGMIFIFFLFIIVLLIEYIPEILKKNETKSQDVNKDSELSPSS